jgi:hypothetical protein
MVDNIGFDGSGQNCGIDDNWRTRVARLPLTQFPANYFENRDAIETIKHSFCNKVKKPSIVDGILKSMRDYLRK